MMTACEGMYGGLNSLAELLQVERVGPMHQAGSDSMLTNQTFFTLVEKQLGGTCDDSRLDRLLHCITYIANIDTYFSFFMVQGFVEKYLV